MDNICDLNSCTACSCCVNICPKNSIVLQPDKKGFLYPHIDNTTCIDCGLCAKRCPANSNPINNKPLSTYASWSLDSEDRATSSSGALGSVLSNYILEQQGIVYGVSIDENLNVKHIRVDEIDEVWRLKGSKYVQSELTDTYSRIKADLKEGKRVLFIGVPCQVDGLNRYIGKPHQSLLTVDLICHGVPNLTRFKSSLPKSMIKHSISFVNFRGNKSQIFQYKTEGDDYLKRSLFGTLYTSIFMEGMFYRSSCYQCKYATGKRVSDITIGDFWGLGRKKPIAYSVKKGVSVALINTIQGKDLFERVTDKLYIEERDLDEAVAGNAQLRFPSRRPIDLERRYNKLAKIVGHKLSLFILLKKNVLKYYLFPLYLKLRK